MGVDLFLLVTRIFINSICLPQYHSLKLRIRKVLYLVLIKNLGKNFKNIYPYYHNNPKNEYEKYSFNLLYPFGF